MQGSTTQDSLQGDSFVLTFRQLNAFSWLPGGYIFGWHFCLTNLGKLFGFTDLKANLFDWKVESCHLSAGLCCYFYDPNSSTSNF